MVALEEEVWAEARWAGEDSEAEVVAWLAGAGAASEAAAEAGAEAEDRHGRR